MTMSREKIADFDEKVTYDGKTYWGTVEEAPHQENAYKVIVFIYNRKKGTGIPTKVTQVPNERAAFENAVHDIHKEYLGTDAE